MDKFLESLDMKYGRDYLERYSRQIIIPGIGYEGQKKLQSSKALVIGLGALGSIAAAYIVAAGVGKVGLVDYGVVELSNLHRQFLYDEITLGKKKTEVLAERLKTVNSTVKIIKYDMLINENNINSILHDYDIVLDCTDNHKTRYAINDACVRTGKPVIFGAVYRFYGYVSVFYSLDGPCYRCVFPNPPPEDFIPSCSESGIFGPLTGIIGSIQASEALKYLILGRENTLLRRLMLIDVVTMQIGYIPIEKDPNCSVCKPHTKIDIAEQKRFNFHDPPIEITVDELKTKLESENDIMVIDIRDAEEYKKNHITKAFSIPYSHLFRNINKFRNKQEIVLYCDFGMLSYAAAVKLRELGFRNVYSLKGGLAEWSAKYGKEN